MGLLDASSLSSYHGSLEGNNAKGSVIVASAKLATLFLFQQHGFAHFKVGFLHTVGAISIFFYFNLVLPILGGCLLVLFRGEVV